MEAICTRIKIVRLIDDIEMITKELVELVSLPKTQQQKLGNVDSISLMELLIQKDAELKSSLKLAEEQAVVQHVLDGLKLEVEKRDVEIKNLQCSLKETETILATAIYQATRKLAAVSQANHHSTSSEEIIKFAHRISACNAVAAPVTWVPGDPRRPYPTDLDMRQSFLGMSSIPDHSQQPLSQVSSETHTGVGVSGAAASSVLQMVGSSLSWQPSQEVSHSIVSTASHHIPHEINDVELMSTDTSSSSSSDE